jgi:hypothetical protein
VCGHTPVDADVNGRFTTTVHACLAVLIIEFDPPDQPGIRARIERIDEPADCERLGAAGVQVA